MAKKTATAFKAAIALAATDLNTAFEDGVTAGQMANEFRNATERLRRLDALFLIDPVTGQFTANDAYIDAAYAGNLPMKATGNHKTLPPFTP